jgi:hypothetical protein
LAYQEYREALGRASNTCDWENTRSLGPTRSTREIYGLADELWDEFVGILKKSKSQAAKILLKGIENMDIEENAFLYAKDEVGL